MQTLRKFVLPEIIFGEQAISLCEQYASNFGSTKPLIVTDDGVLATGLVDSIYSSLKSINIKPEIFSNIQQNPKDFQVAAGKDFYKAKNCDIIIGIGGGSPMDCAKAIGILVSGEKEKIEDYEGIDQVLIPAPPLLCIPTTAGTSADISQFAIINHSEQKYKFAIISKTLIPDVALVDPITTYTMDPYLTACTGIDALVHAIEAFVSLANSSLTDLHAIEAIRIISENLVDAVHEPRNAHARKMMMHASMQAGMAFSNASLGVVHAMAHSLGGYLDLPHGECNALLLNAAINANYPHASKKYRKIAEVLNVCESSMNDLDCKEALIAYISSLLNKVGIHGGLLQRGVKKEDLPTLVEHAIKDPCAVTNPMPVNYENTWSIYEQSF